MKIIVEKENIGERLDQFLQGKLDNLSRAQIQKKIKAGEILVGGKTVAPHYFLKGGEQIEGKRQKAKGKEENEEGKRQKVEGKEENEEGKRQKVEGKEENEKGKMKKEKGKRLRVKIVAEDKDFVVVNKPAGIVVHPDNIHKKDTLVDWLIKKYPEIKNIGEDAGRPGIVHRLDKEVSGLMVASRTQKMFDCLKEQFKNRKIVKEYSALVHGVVQKNEGTVGAPIGRSRAKGTMTAGVANKEAGREARTDYEVVKRFRNFTLLKIRIFTGRTHQIRVHMKTIGHSVVGDKVYATRDIKKKGKDEGLNRLWLFAERLWFSDLTGAWQKFEIKTPRALKDFLEKIK